MPELQPVVIDEPILTLHWREHLRWWRECGRLRYHGVRAATALGPASCGEILHCWWTVAACTAVETAFLADGVGVLVAVVVRDEAIVVEGSGLEGLLRRWVWVLLIAWYCGYWALRVVKGEERVWLGLGTALTTGTCGWLLGVCGLEILGRRGEEV